VGLVVPVTGLGMAGLAGPFEATSFTLTGGFGATGLLVVVFFCPVFFLPAMWW
jgi:hypothetical protein